MNKSYLSKSEVQGMLGVSAVGLWRLVRKHQEFPQPTQRPCGPLATFRDKMEPQEAWDGAEVYRWAAGAPEFAHRGAVLLRPLPEGLPSGRWAGCKDTAKGPALDWHTAIGTIRIVHSDEREAASAVSSALVGAGNPDGVVIVCALSRDTGITEPALVASDTARPDIEYEAAWEKVAALAGQPLPWWPRLLRLPRLIRAWEPGTPPTVTKVPSDDNETILRSAARSDAFDIASRAAVTAMANDIRNHRTDSVAHENGAFGGKGSGEGPNPVVIAAEPDTSHHPLPSLDDRQALKAGWRKLALSDSPDAAAALAVAAGHDPGLLPYGALTEVPVQSGTIIERWARRLAMCDPTAAHAVLADGSPAEAFFIDPLTGTPVLRAPGYDGTPVWRFYAPLCLPARGEELSSAVLQHTVWITTSDGHVHPAPCPPTGLLWWGNRGDCWGDEASEAATVIDALLDDLGASVNPGEPGRAPQGLIALFNQDHQHGAELTRGALLHARMSPVRTR